ncbi:DUF4352 domain-containing protein [Streptomyces lunaelactis]|uniref:DUF4352 domain-containing protein n=1 Tax=Streptomyces lunaelactis TaxID=1535768 RepID=UPI0015856F4A|nr:DUF4352 domain-containing protein [Streptomyces lunaelactis]NUK22057.1 DUF4352 domain-containing protein [Streptomyces lunaelactis]
MSHQHPGQQQPYQGGPAPYQPPPPPKKRMSPWAIVGITIGGIFALLIIIGIALGGGTDDTADDKPKSTPSSAPSKPAEKQADAPAKPKPAVQAPVKVTAKKTAFVPGVLHDGGAYTSVQVTITNNSNKKIDINPLYFSVTDTAGSKHTAELGVDERQMDTVDLAPGENITGVITGKGTFTPKYVTYVDGLIGDSVRGNVS